MSECQKLIKVRNWTLYVNEKCQFTIEGQFKSKPEIIVPFVDTQLNRENIHDMFYELRSEYMYIKQIPQYVKAPFIQAILKHKEELKRERRSREIRERMELGLYE